MNLGPFTCRRQVPTVTSCCLCSNGYETQSHDVQHSSTLPSTHGMTSIVDTNSDRSTRVNAWFEWALTVEYNELRTVVNHKISIEIVNPFLLIFVVSGLK